MWRRYFALIGINLIVFVVLAEILALAFHYAETGRVFYAHHEAHPVIEDRKSVV